MNLIHPLFKLTKGLIDPITHDLLPDEECEWFLEQEAVWRKANPKLTTFQARQLFGLAPPEGAIRGQLNREDVVARVDMLVLLNAYVPGPYRPIGNNRLQVKCPYHDDHTPSMTVDLEKKRWRCWVEQEGGSCVDLVMRSESLGFLPALRRLNELFP